MWLMRVATKMVGGDLLSFYVMWGGGFEVASAVQEVQQLASVLLAIEIIRVTIKFQF